MVNCCWHIPTCPKSPSKFFSFSALLWETACAANNRINSHDIAAAVETHVGPARPGRVRQECRPFLLPRPPLHRDRGFPPLSCAWPPVCPHHPDSSLCEAVSAWWKRLSHGWGLTCVCVGGWGEGRGWENDGQYITSPTPPAHKMSNHGNGQGRAHSWQQHCFLWTERLSIQG